MRLEKRERRKKGCGGSRSRRMKSIQELVNECEMMTKRGRGLCWMELMESEKNAILLERR